MYETEWKTPPLTQAEAAKVIGVSYRGFLDILKRLEAMGVETHELRGARRKFYPTHIRAIREALKCPKTPGPRTGTKKPIAGRSNSRSTVSDIDAAFEFVARAA